MEQLSERARVKKKERVAAKKEKARAEGTQFRDALTYKVRRRFSGKYQDVLVISCDIDVSYLPHASSSYVGARQTAGNEHITLETLLGEGFKLIEWDGRQVLFSRHSNTYSWQNQHTYPHNRQGRADHHHLGWSTCARQIVGPVDGPPPASP